MHGSTIQGSSGTSTQSPTPLYPEEGCLFEKVEGVYVVVVVVVRGGGGGVTPRAVGAYWPPATYPCPFLQASAVADTELTDAPNGVFKAWKNGENEENGRKGGEMEENWGIHEQIRMDIYTKTNEGKLEKGRTKMGEYGNKTQNMRSNHTCVDYNHGGGATTLKPNDTKALCVSCSMLYCLSEDTGFQTEKLCSTSQEVFGMHRVRRTH